MKTFKVVIRRTVMELLIVSAEDRAQAESTAQRGEGIKEMSTNDKVEVMGVVEQPEQA